jgi:hypothetical protein
MSADSVQLAPMRPGTSFQSRITGVAMITAVAVLLAACAAFIAEQWRTGQHDAAGRQAALTQSYAYSTTMRAAFAEPARAQRAVTRLAQLQPGMSGIYLLDLQGRVIAAYGPPTPAAAAAMGLHEESANVRPNRVGEPLGRIVTFASLPSVWSILPRYLALTAALFFAATGLALFLGRWLAARVTEPVHRLSQVMRHVA